MNNTLFESVIDLSLKNYSPQVFSNYESSKPILNDRVRNKIIKDVKYVNKVLKVKDIFIKGSILTKQYTKDSDIDVYIQINSASVDDTLKKQLKKILLYIDNTKLNNISHPFQYYITKDSYNLENTEAAYNIIKNEWIKRTPSKDIKIDDYFDNFKSYINKFSDFSEELRRNMIDYEILKDIPNDQINGLKQKLDNELKEINSSINKLADVYSDIKDFRNKAFDDTMSPSDIKKYGIKTKLPGNVVWKLIERYHYLDLYKTIRKIIGDDNKISHDEYDELNKFIKTDLTNEKISFKNLFKGKIKGRKDLQHKPKHRQQQNNAGMIGQGSRKSLNVLPDYQRKNPLKSNRLVSNAKTTSKVLHVKQGSPEALELAQKYRIQDPRGKKTVSGNQYDDGITIIFTESLEQKVNRVNKILNSKL